MSFGGSVKLTGESEYKKALKEINQNLKEVSSEIKVVTSEFDKNDKSTAALSKQSEVLSKKYDEQDKKVKVLTERYNEVNAQYGKNSDAQKKLQAQLTEERAKLDAIGNTLGKTSKEYQAQQKVITSLENKQTSYNNAVSNAAIDMNKAQAEANKTKRELDNLEKSTEQLGKATEETGKQTENASGKFSKMGDIAKTAGAALATAAAAIGTAAVAAGKKIWDLGNEVSSTGDVIDKESQKLGISAENYQTLSYAMERSGASIDDFSKGMKTITKELAGAENGVKGAGKSFDELGVSLKNADGSMKSSEQVLLDSIDALSQMENETQRNALAQQIFGKSAAELNPLLNSGSEGIKQLMQEAKDYGMVMSDDAVSASATFQDSLTRMNGTLDGLKNNMVGSFLPGLTAITDGFTDMIAGVDGGGEKLKNGVTQVITQISALIPQFVELITTISAAVLESAPSIIQALAEGIITSIPTLMPTITNVITSLVGMLLKLMPDIIGAGIEIITSLIEGISKELPTLIKMLPKIVKEISDTLIKNLPMLIKAGIELLVALIDGLGDAIPQLVDYIPEIIDTIVTVLIDNLPMLVDAAIQLMVALTNGLIQSLPKLATMTPKIITTIVTTLIKNLPQIIQGGVKIVASIIEGIGKNLANLATQAKKIGQTVLDKIKEFPSKMLSAGKDLVKGIWEGITGSLDWIKGKIKGWVGNVTNFIKKLFGINSPSTLMRDEVGKNLALGIGEGFSDEMQNVTKEMQDALPTSFDTSINSHNGYNTAAQYMTYADIVNAFKTALSQMVVEMDDEQMGKFVERTVTRAIYT